MGEAKRRREAGEGQRKDLFTFGATLARKMDLDEMIALFEANVEANRVRSILQIHLVETGVEGVLKLEAMPMGMTPREAFQVVSSIKRQMEATFGFGPDDEASHA